jgi:predicted lipid-binding transport protein (Tim44 family)
MLRSFVSLLLVFLVTMGLVMQDAEAKRFGGGRSFGVQRSTSTLNRSASSGANFAQSKLNQAGSTASKWLGPLAGLAAGGLLASLFMGHGIGSGILSWLVVGGLLLLVISFFRNRSSRMQPAPQQSHQEFSGRNNFAQDAAAQFMRNSSSSNSSINNQNYASATTAESHSYPVGFNATQFLLDAKVQFIRLQAAYDQKNLNDLRDFTSPEVYAEIQLQFQERGNEGNKTDVVSLDADLLDVIAEPQNVGNTEMQNLVASVRFSGLIQENRNEPAAAFKEIWHFKKEVAHQRWIVTGIEQN